MTETADRLLVLTIVGKGRSGSTLLDNALGEVPGFVTVGELYHLWDWGLMRGYRCGCGVPVPTCPFWTGVLARLQRRLGPLDPAEVLRWQAEALSWRRIPRMLRLRRSRRDWAAASRYTDVTEQLYRAIAEEAGASIIVDASKWPASPAALGLVDVDGLVLHLVRDPRAVVHSWQRHKELTDREPGAEFPRWGAVHSSLSWVGRNVTADLVRARRGSDSSLRLRYEDLVADPTGTLRNVVSRATGAADPDLTFVEGRFVTTGVNHTVGGNTNRMRPGRREIRRDDEWARTLSMRDRIVTTALTWPWMLSYGYPLRGPRRAEPRDR